MVAQPMPFLPRRQPLWRLVTTMDALKIWPDFAFEVDFNRRLVLGIDTFLLNDPEDIRHVLTVVLAHLLSRVGLGLASAKPVMPSARVTTAPSYEPKFSLERL